MVDDEILRRQYGCAAGPVVTATIVRTPNDGLEITDTAIARGGWQMPVYAAKPSGKADLPIVLVICEAFGLNEHIRDVARRFAREGYLAIAPDLMKRQGDPLGYGDFESLLDDLLLTIPDKQVMADLDACVDWARDRDRLTATGFCWGGRWLWLYAAHRAFGAAVSWYGLLDADSGVLPADSTLMPRHPIDLVDDLRTPVLNLYGGRDPGIPEASIDAMRDRLAWGGVAARHSRIETYPQAGHAFFADYRQSYEPVAAADGWKRCLAWIAEKLG